MLSLYYHTLLLTLSKLFLIDDSATMAAHWDEVVKAIWLLGYIVKRFDKNGIDVSFTISDKKYNMKHTSPMVEAVERHRPPQGSSISPNMTWKLEAILGKYRKALDKKQATWLSLPFSKDVKKTILFVFTDGRWEPESNAERPIEKFVHSLKECGLPEHQFGIQFIRFGDNPAGIDILDRLDDFVEEL